MSKTLILSDVHLDAFPEGEALRLAFVEFLDGLAETDVNRLFVLGDLFDFWFEYRHVVFSGYFDILRAFARLNDRGVELHLVCGNHDFWAGRFLHDTLGFSIHRDRVAMDFGKRRAFLIHGDGLNPQDIGYRTYKKLARSKWVIAAFRRIHPDCAMGIARVVSRGSRRLTEVVDPSKGAEAQALRAFARGVLERGEADVVLCGHAHAAVFEEYQTTPGSIPTPLYINAGDWRRERTHVEWDDRAGEFRLIRPGASMA